MDRHDLDKVRLLRDEYMRHLLHRSALVRELREEPHGAVRNANYIYLVEQEIHWLVSEISQIVKLLEGVGKDGCGLH